MSIIIDPIPERLLNNGRPKPIRNREKPIQKYRLYVQIAFALLCLWIGIEFHFFVTYLETQGAVGFSHRPPGVEGFLPISALMSLYYFLLGGGIHPIHPAGLFILLGIIGVSVVFGKAFCSWLCPVGFLSEMLGDIGEKMFGKKLTPPRGIDWVLRSLKYLLLGFFVYAIFFLMSAAALATFLDSPYNRVADIRMYYFFRDISQTSLVVIAVLFGLSILVRNFWCRYLCPYGALLGVVAFFSPNKIRRNEISCIDCAKCAKVCPARIKVDKVKTVWSDECTSCLNCVDVCPVADTLQVTTIYTNKPLPKRWVAIGVAVVFVSIAGLGMLTGRWQNAISTDEYLYHQKHLMNYGHPTGSNDIQQMNREAAPSH